MITLLSPHGTRHTLEARAGRWWGYENIAMGFPPEQARQVIHEVIAALNLQRELPHGFTVYTEPVDLPAPPLGEH